MPSGVSVATTVSKTIVCGRGALRLWLRVGPPLDVTVFEAVAAIGGATAPLAAPHLPACGNVAATGRRPGPPSPAARRAPAGFPGIPHADPSPRADRQAPPCVTASSQA